MCEKVGDGGRKRVRGIRGLMITVSASNQLYGDVSRLVSRECKRWAIYVLLGMLGDWAYGA